jgi:TFIIF-interacting CTD phosphatase-like protein
MAVHDTFSCRILASHSGDYEGYYRRSCMNSDSNNFKNLISILAVSTANRKSLFTKTPKESFFSYLLLKTKPRTYIFKTEPKV